MAAPTKPLVSDLVSSISSLPANYVRPESDRPNLSEVTLDYSIPLIDLQGLHGPDHSKVIKEIAEACKHYGFFQVKNHGVPKEVIDKMLSISREFYHLPESERMKNYSDDPMKTTRLSTSFNVKTEKDRPPTTGCKSRALVNCSEERISISTFYCPSPDAVIGPAQQLIDEDHPPLYRNYLYSEYYQKFWNRGLNSETCLDMFKN
ncbi:hypothetical protein SLEP1_g24242 [Rubroshorea leprosula]|uniref:Non-haem dioxygenase N-terminal domain-containing protein n=1 Tax=Rubroshorea leprosula TaxID=152421 RepID=A0AAV5JK86_9ROSI|nr:hypothetical protein SLEP1_g24242 [Rubroshorea leprosula]